MSRVTTEPDGNGRSLSPRVACIVFGLLALVLLSASASASLEAQEAQKPNIIFIVTDDQDTASTRYMPTLESLLKDDGLIFKNAFVTYSFCCPSRATFLTGRYPHNHGVIDNGPPEGGVDKFRATGAEDSTVATWLNAAGYRTVHVGKYLNGYDGSYVPSGWGQWHGWIGGTKTGDMNDNGIINHYDGYHTDVLADIAVRYIKDSAYTTSPFFMHLATHAPHGPSFPAERHKGMFSTERLPKPPSFNEEDVSDKPAWIRDTPLLTDDQARKEKVIYRRRLESLQAVDEMLGRIEATLQATGQMENTYIFFTSDNGYHQGQHRLDHGKRTAYEEDIRVPLLVRGPDVPAGRVRGHMVLNNDLATTFADIAQASVPETVDGRSVKPLLTSEPPPPSEWRQRFLVMNWRRTTLSGIWPPPSYEGVRTKRYLYVEYSTGEHELYDLRNDPYELSSQHATADLDLRATLSSNLAALRDCSMSDCRNAEGP